jgi:hypothetical protein
MYWVLIAVVMLVVVGVANAKKSRSSQAVSQVAFRGFTHHAIGSAKLADKGDSTLRVSIGPSGRDGVQIHLDRGVTAFRVDATVVNGDSLPDGAWLEFGSRVEGSKDSVGFVRLTRAGGSGYSMSGAVAGASDQILALYRSGAEVYRDPRLTSPIADLVRGNGCMVCGFSTNDDVGHLNAGAFVLLRAAWAEGHELTVVNRPGGAHDTTIVADEIRIMPTGGATSVRTLSDFVLRGKDLGELRIRSEVATRQ